MKPKMSKSHFWILLHMGYDMQRIWDYNYSEDMNTIYLDYKDCVRYSKQDGQILFDYTRYKIFIPTRTQQRFLTIRRPDGFDYNNYFSNNHLAIEL